MVAYLVYIKEQYDRQPNIISIEEFKKLAVIHTNKGMLKPCDTPIHFSGKYGNRLNLEKNLSGMFDMPAPYDVVFALSFRSISNFLLLNCWVSSAFCKRNLPWI